MKHICEFCNKQYNTVTEAKRCEFTHEKGAEAQASAATKINIALNEYVATYKELPRFEFTPDNQEILFSFVADEINSYFSSLTNMIFDEDDEEDMGTNHYCNCNKCNCDCKKTDSE